jgi:L-malate glycosyltransferase
MMNEKIGLVIGQLGYGGAERQLALLAGGLAGAGEKVHVFCLSETVKPHGLALEAAGVELTVIPRRGPYEPLRVIRLASALRRNGITLVHSFLEVATIYSYLASQFYRLPPLLPSLRSLPVRESWPHRMLLGRALRYSTLVTANSEAGAEAYQRRYLRRGSAIEVIPNGVEEMPAISAVERLAARRLYGVRESGPVVGTVSKDDPDKNVPAFLRLAAGLGKKLGTVCTMLAGRGLDESYAVRQGVVRQALCDSFFLGELEEMRPFYAALDLLVITSLREGMPNVVLEAQMCGVPVVAFDIGGMRETMDPGRTGLLAPAGDEAALLEMTADLLADRKRLDSFGEQARQYTINKFGVETMVRSTLALYDRVPGVRSDNGACQE